jgi:DNA-binding transcriptional MerR regulator
MKRRGNRRYYQHHEVLLVRRIRELLYEEGFTINGARNRLGETQQRAQSDAGADMESAGPMTSVGTIDLAALRAELEQALQILAGEPSPAADSTQTAEAAD